jgi:hypothetical protein
MNFAEHASEIAGELPLAERLTVLARFGFMQMTAGNVEAARKTAREIDDGLDEAGDRGLSCPEVATELESLGHWINSAAQEKPDPRREGIDLADQILARPQAISHLTEAIRSGKLSSLGSRAIGDAAEELYRRGEHGHARALLDGVANTEAGHRARLRTGLLLKREPVPGVDAEALVAGAIADAAHMDNAEGKTARRQFLAGIALMSFDDVDVAQDIMQALLGQGHHDLSAGIKQRLARGLLAAGRAEEAKEFLLSIRSATARELAISALLDELAAASGTAAARVLVEEFTTPAAVASARAKLAIREAQDDPSLSHTDLKAALGVVATLRETHPFFYTAISDTLSAYAAVDEPGTDADAAVIRILDDESPFLSYRLRLAEHLAGALVAHGRTASIPDLAEQLDRQAAAVILMRASLP